MTRCFYYKVFLLQGVFVTRWVWVLQIQLWDLIVKRLPRQWKAVSPRRRGFATSSRGSSRSLHCERQGSSRWSSASRAGTTSWTHSSVSSRGSSCASSSKKTQSIKMTRFVEMLWAPLPIQCWSNQSLFCSCSGPVAKLQCSARPDNWVQHCEGGRGGWCRTISQRFCEQHLGESLTAQPVYGLEKWARI